MKKNLQNLTLSHMAPVLLFCAWPGGHLSPYAKTTLHEISDEFDDVREADRPLAIHRTHNSKRFCEHLVYEKVAGQSAQTCMREG
jgi:hypothetical protein